MLNDVMKRHHKARSGLPLGGIGAGWFELRKDGVFYNWSIFNNSPWGTGARFPDGIPYTGESVLFFIVRWQVKGKHPQMKILQIEDGRQIGHINSQIYQFPWMDGVDE